MATRIFLDFDGVLCDSLIECFISSYWAFKNRVPSPEEAIPQQSQKEQVFRVLRPFIRSGEEYVLIHEILDQEEAIPQDQTAFDLRIQQAGIEGMKQKKEKLYAVRQDLLENQSSWWLSLNPPFPGIKEALATVAAQEKYHILSTKKSNFIQKILESWGINWPMHRIHLCATGESKARIILSQGLKPDETLLVDDHEGHLKEAQDLGIPVFWALWGYISPDSPEGSKLPSLTLDVFCQKLKDSSF